MTYWMAYRTSPYWSSRSKPVLMQKERAARVSVSIEYLLWSSTLARITFAD
jgi:hypothetical protein